MSNVSREFENGRAKAKVLIQNFFHAGVWHSAADPSPFKPSTPHIDGGSQEPTDYRYDVLDEAGRSIAKMSLPDAHGHFNVVSVDHAKKVVRVKRS